MEIKKKRQRRNKDRDYISGPELHKRLSEWYESEEDEIPNFIAIGILQIIDNYGKKGKFAGYSYLDEMKDDALVSCIKALRDKKYDIYRENPNPFAYFTQIIHNAFINRINQEHKQSYIKYKQMHNEIHLLICNGEEPPDLSDGYERSDLEKKFEKKKTEKAKKVSNNLDQFLEEENES